MATKDSILAVLSIQPSTGYDLKKKLTDLAPFSWIVSSQIYKVLTDLHKEGFATVDIDASDDMGRKEYSITARGRKAVRIWLTEDSELPEVKNEFQQKLLIASLQDDQELVLELLKARQQSIQLALRGARKAQTQQRLRTQLLQAIDTDLDLGDVSGFPEPSKRAVELIPIAVTEYRNVVLRAELQWIESLIATLK